MPVRERERERESDLVHLRAILVSDDAVGGRRRATFPLTEERRGHYKLLPLPVGSESDSPSISRIWPSIEIEGEGRREGRKRRKSYWPLLIKIPEKGRKVGDDREKQEPHT